MTNDATRTLPKQTFYNNIIFFYFRGAWEAQGFPSPEVVNYLVVIINDQYIIAVKLVILKFGNLQKKSPSLKQRLTRVNATVT